MCHLALTVLYEPESGLDCLTCAIDCLTYASGGLHLKVADAVKDVVRGHERHAQCLEVPRLLSSGLRVEG